MKHTQWLTATAMLWHFGSTLHAAQNSGEYKAVHMLIVPNEYKIPVALSVNGDTVAVGFAHNVTRLHRLSDAPVNGTISINAYENMGEEKPRTIAVKFFPDNNLCLVDRIGMIRYARKPYNAIQTKREIGRSTFCAAINKDILCLGFDGDAVQVVDHFGMPKKRYHGSAAGHVNAIEIVDNKFIVTGNFDGTVAVMDIEQGDVPVILGDHGDRGKYRNNLYCMAKQDAAVLYTGGNHHEIKLWDIRSRKPMGEPFTYATTNALALSKAGYLIAGFGNKIGVFDLRGVIRQPLELLEAGNKTGCVTALAATDDGGFVSATSNGVVKVWK